VEFRNAPFEAVGGKWHLMLKKIPNDSPFITWFASVRFWNMERRRVPRMSDERVTRESAELVAKIKYLSPHQKGTRPLR
jgi:hypothetical protein